MKIQSNMQVNNTSFKAPISLYKVVEGAGKPVIKAVEDIGGQSIIEVGSNIVFMRNGDFDKAILAKVKKINLKDNGTSFVDMDVSYDNGSRVIKPSDQYDVFSAATFKRMFGQIKAILLKMDLNNIN
jgi:hypothetical protein